MLDGLVLLLSQEPVMKAAFFGMLVLSLSFHEFGHAWTSRTLGDDTAERLGRVTLNPLPHLDPVFSVLLPLFLLFSGAGILFGAGKPVPVDPRKLRRPGFDMMLISTAGPFMNVVLAVLLTLLYRVLLGRGAVEWGSPGSVLLFTAIQLNLILAVFNMIPVPPLDGHRVLGFFLPPRARRAFYRSHWLGLVVLGVLVLGPGFRLLHEHVLIPLGQIYRPLMPDGVALFGY